MKGKWKRSIVIVFAIALVISAGVYSSDHFLKATDGEENIVEAPEEAGEESEIVAEEAELPEEEETVMTIEQGYFESDLIAEENALEGIIAEDATGKTPVSAEAQLSDEELEALLAKGDALTEEEMAVLIENGKLTEEEAATILAKNKPAATAKSVKIAYEIIGGEYTGVGSQIELSAVLTGYDGLNPSYQWQYSDGGEWKDIDGATSSVYLLNVTEENSTYNWRVSVSG